jgi:uncharacterized LabA/DUF88 family protein
MTSKNAIVFIDGNNWYHNIKGWFSKPSDIDFWELSKFICDFLKLDLIEIFYYNSVPSIADGETIYYRHMEFLSDLEKRGIHVITRKLQRNSTKEIIAERESIMKALDLCENCKPLVKTGFVESLGSIEKKEKGIDVQIAVDMINKSMITNKCDCCILISGDADFIPAMQIIKDSGKEVITSMVPYGYSNQLKNSGFRYLILRRRDLIEQCMKSYREIKK